MDIQFCIGRREAGDVPSRRALACTFPELSEEYLREVYTRDKVVTIKCNTDKFGEFIARRVTNGCTSNGIMQLNVKIICDPRPCSQPARFQTEFDFR